MKGFNFDILKITFSSYSILIIGADIKHFMVIGISCFQNRFADKIILF